MNGSRDHALVYFPEGVLHADHEGVRPFGIPARLERMLVSPQWIPTAVVIRWTTESKPTALISAGQPHDTLDGNEYRRLSTLYAETRVCDPATGRTILDGHRGQEERIALGYRTRTFFTRYL